MGGRKGPASKRFVSGAQLFMNIPAWKLKTGETQEAFLRRVFKKMRDLYKVAAVSRRRRTRLGEGRLRRMIKSKLQKAAPGAGLRKPGSN